MIWRWPSRLPSGRTVAIAGGAVLAVMLLGAGAWLWYGLEQRRAEAAYAEAFARLPTAALTDAPVPERTAAIEALQTTLARYPSASMAAQAAYALGNLRYAGREYPQARAAYEIVLARSAPPTLRTLARAGIAYTHEAEGNGAKAVEAFQAALAGLEPGDFLFEELLADLGRTQALAGLKPQAIETYRRFLKEIPSSRRADDIRARLTALGAAP
jgi:tetratricopeptide (TPR) repeat protein